ncbi:chorismate--pyruvate lyase family protein [Agitococcus lubricus]|uniref:Probable chorismate pyruvate-lyase n=1 Tax=Agitococcus lubricus TaxID=1077255 RepID=A0A2T5J389_9GAMM|nr:chorismate lyase [Agitococcus lubricus]PTQ91046.1 chorismate lyase [Agitococcus lubricus]
MTLSTPWLSQSRYWQAQLASPAKEWLLSRGSLTAYLMTLSKGQFRVRVMAQGWHKPRLDERLSLGLPAQQWVWVREVALEGEGQIWVEARSIIPLRTLRGKGGRLRYLGSRSLGSLLFKGGKRGAMLIAKTERTQPRWLRRSCFYYDGRALLVQEAFLPALFSAAQGRQLIL